MNKNIFYYVIRFDYSDGTFNYLKSYGCLGLFPVCSSLLGATEFYSLESVKSELDFISHFCDLPDNLVCAKVVKILLREISFICK